MQLREVGRERIGCKAPRLAHLATVHTRWLVPAALDGLASCHVSRWVVCGGKGGLNGSPFRNPPAQPDKPAMRVAPRH